MQSCVTMTSSSTRKAETRSKSHFCVVKRGGKVISVAGPPEPAFARDFGVIWRSDTGDTRAQLARQTQGKATWGDLFVPVYEGEWRPTA